MANQAWVEIGEESGSIDGFWKSGQQDLEMSLRHLQGFRMQVRWVDESRLLTVEEIGDYGSGCGCTTLRLIRWRRALDEGVDGFEEDDEEMDGL